MKKREEREKTITMGVCGNKSIANTPFDCSRLNYKSVYSDAPQHKICVQRQSTTQTQHLQQYSAMLHTEKHLQQPQNRIWNKLFTTKKNDL